MSVRTGKRMASVTKKSLEGPRADPDEAPGWLWGLWETASIRTVDRTGSGSPASSHGGFEVLGFPGRLGLPYAPICAYAIPRSGKRRGLAKGGVAPPLCIPRLAAPLWAMARPRNAEPTGPLAIERRPGREFTRIDGRDREPRVPQLSAVARASSGWKGKSPSPMPAADREAWPRWEICLSLLTRHTPAPCSLCINVSHTDSPATTVDPGPISAFRAAGPLCRGAIPGQQGWRCSPLPARVNGLRALRRSTGMGSSCPCRRLSDPRPARSTMSSPRAS